MGESTGPLAVLTDVPRDRHQLKNAIIPRCDQKKEEMLYEQFTFKARHPFALLVPLTSIEQVLPREVCPITKRGNANIG